MSHSIRASIATWFRVCLAIAALFNAESSRCRQNGIDHRQLILRHQVLEDLDSLYEIYQDPEVTRFIPDAPQTY
jgi:hypothetical protein